MQGAYLLLHSGGLGLLESLSVVPDHSAEAGAALPAAAAPVLLSQLKAAAALANGMPLQQQLEAGLLQPAKLRAWLSVALQLLHLLRDAGLSGKEGWDRVACNAMPCLVGMRACRCAQWSCVGPSFCRCTTSSRRFPSPLTLPYPRRLGAAARAAGASAARLDTLQLQ